VGVSHWRIVVRLLGLAALLCFGRAALAQVHDYANLPEARLLQTPKGVTGHLPRGIDGQIDWVRALEKGLIKPRETRTGEPREPEIWGEMPTEGIVFRNTQFMPYVVFPHQPHAEWLTCANCHKALFELRTTGRGKGMVAILRGEHCGACHGRVAFSPMGACYRCHSLPNPEAVKEGSPFVEPKKIETPQSAFPEEKPRRRGANKPQGGQGGRLVPSVVPPEVVEPVAVPKLE